MKIATVVGARPQFIKAAVVSRLFRTDPDVDELLIHTGQHFDYERVSRICADGRFPKLILTQPVGYLTSISLVKGAEKIVTDSGGLQREAFFAEKQCVTVFDLIVWPETMVDNRNQLSAAEHTEILKKLSEKQTVDPSYKPFGDGKSAEKIAGLLKRY